MAATRRRMLAGTAATTLAWAVALPCRSADAAAATTDNAAADLAQLKKGLAQVDDLLANWDDRTLNCRLEVFARESPRGQRGQAAPTLARAGVGWGRFAEVNKNLLENKNKEALLESASKNVLFDKGMSSRTLCKNDPEIVRKVFGLGGDAQAKAGPPSAFAAPGIYTTDDQKFYLKGVDQLVQRGLERLEDGLDEYVEAQEQWIQGRASLNSMAYASGASDMGSIIQAQRSAGGDGGNTYLASAKRAARQCQVALATIVALLDRAAVVD